MSSHGGQQNFPFGYQPENLHGIGLPEFMTPGPPPGQPLLNAHENRDLDNFFQGFDQNAAANKAFAHTQFSSPADHDHLFDMPPMFVGSDTALAQRSIIDQHQLAGAGFPYGDGFLGHDMNTVSQTTPLVPGMHGVSYSDATFQNPLIAQLQSAASMQPAYTQGWQQSYPPQNAIRIPPQGRLGMDFGTDSRFQPTGYAAPHNPMDPDLPQGLQMNNPIGEWLEPASGSTTQPNTQPNTQPSSPTWSKKRNFDDFVRDQQPRNGFVASAQQTSMAQPSPTQSNPRRKRSEIKIEKRASISQPPTPLSNSKPHSPLNSNNLGIGEQEPDAEAEAEAEREDEEDATEPPRSPSPAPWPASKARPPRNTKAPPPKLPRKKNVSAHTSTPSKPKSKVQRPSVTSTRVPLSLEQKKANHTNSEQRRRDATARAYAELYDLVPELEDMGKQSTMKRLEVVVAKVQRVKQKVEELRAKLGMEPLTGRPISGPSGGSAMLLYSDVPGWPQ